MAVRKRGLVSLGQEDTQQGKVRVTISYYSGFTAIIHCMFLPPYEGSVVIDGYTHNSTLTSGDSVPLGTQIILVCQVVGLPYGTPLSYNWTCPNGDCLPKVAEGSDPYNYNRKIYNDSILAVNSTNTYYRGTYTCRVTATGRQEATGSFNINITGTHVLHNICIYCSCKRYKICIIEIHSVVLVCTKSGGRVVHSYGRLIPHEFPITDLQQISGPDGIGRITCTVSSGTARFVSPGGVLESDGVTQTRHGATAALVVNPTDSFSNRDVYCSDTITNYFYLFISAISEFTDIIACNHHLKYSRFGVPIRSHLHFAHCTPVISIESHWSCTIGICLNTSAGCPTINTIVIVVCSAGTRNPQKIVCMCQNVMVIQ